MQRNDVCTSHKEYLNNYTTDADITNLLSTAIGHDCDLNRFGHERSNIRNYYNKLSPLIGGAPIADHQLILFVPLNGFNGYFHQLRY